MAALGGLFSLRELMVQFALAHCSDQNIDDERNPVERLDGDVADGSCVTSNAGPHGGA